MSPNLSSLQMVGFERPENRSPNLLRRAISVIASSNLPHRLLGFFKVLLSVAQRSFPICMAEDGPSILAVVLFRNREDGTSTSATERVSAEID